MHLIEGTVMTTQRVEPKMSLFQCIKKDFSNLVRSRSLNKELDGLKSQFDTFKSCKIPVGDQRYNKIIQRFELTVDELANVTGTSYEDIAFVHPEMDEMRAYSEKKTGGITLGKMIGLTLVVSLVLFVLVTIFSGLQDWHWFLTHHGG